MNWDIGKEDFETTLSRHKRYLNTQDLSGLTVERYLKDIKNLLVFSKDSHPSMEQVDAFKNHLIEDRRVDVYHMFTRYKKIAGIVRWGGWIPYFLKAPPRPIMISKGCDLIIVQKLLRHQDIRPTLRYAHMSDTVARDWYNKTLKN